MKSGRLNEATNDEITRAVRHIVESDHRLTINGIQHWKVNTALAFRASLFIAYFKRNVFARFACVEYHVIDG